MRLLVRNLLVTACTLVGIWVYWVSQDAGSHAFTQLFPGYNSWGDSDLPHPYSLADLLLAECWLIVPALLAGSTGAIPALWLRLPPAAVAITCMLPPTLGVITRFPPNLTELMHYPDQAWIYTCSLLPAAGMGVALWRCRRTLVRRLAAPPEV